MTVIGDMANTPIQSSKTVKTLHSSVVLSIEYANRLKTIRKRTKANMDDTGKSVSLLCFNSLTIE